MIERLLLAGALWSIVLFSLWLCRRQSPLNLFVLALAATGLVGSFFPVLSLWIEPTSWRHISHLPDAIVLEVQRDYLCFAIGLGLACFLGLDRGWLGVRRTAAHAGPSARVAQRDLIIALGLMLVGAPLYYAYVQQTGFEALTNHRDYGAKYLASAGLGPLASGLSLMMLGCLWAEGGALSAGAKWLFRAVAAAIAMWSVGYISVRTNFVVLLMGYLYLVCSRRGLALARVRPALLLALLIAYCGLETFTLFRGAYVGTASEAITHLAGNRDTILGSAVGGSELSHPFITCAEVHLGEEAGSLGGSSYVDALFALAPIGLAPDRPRLLSEVFVRRYYTDYAATGAGTAFSLVAEAWLDFGALIGPLAIGLILGVILILVEHRRAVRPHGLLARITPYLVFLIVILHRSEFGSLLKQVVVISLPALGLWLFAHSLFSLARRRPHSMVALRVAGR